MCFASVHARVRRARASACAEAPADKLALAATALAVALMVAANTAEAQSTALDVLLDRMGAYLQDYETRAFELVADEQYEQWVRRRPGYSGGTIERRKLKSTYFLIRLPDGQAWYGFRDVTSVDGRVVPATRRSMADLLSERTVDAVEEALAITRANARYNIGDVIRTINVPLQALALLVPEHQKRFEFREAGREKVKGQEAAVVAFQERSSPTLISDGFGGDVFSRGRIWVDPTTGTALRTELSFGGPATAYLKENLIRVDFERDSRLQLLVPREMEEIYGLDVEVVHGRASYRNYRRFETGGRLVAPN
jgi:hypothetical protein